MGQSRKQQLDKIFAKYPNKSAAQIAKDHSIPYSTVWKYMQQYKKPLPVIEAEYRPRPKPKQVTYTKGDMMMAVIAGTFTGVFLCLILGAMQWAK